MKSEHKAYLEQYLSTLSAAERQTVSQLSAEYFCADEYNANECARLVNTGKKTATCSLKQSWDIDKEPLPSVGRLTVVLNWQEEPVCIIKTTEVSLCPFNEVTVEFAAAEGEGDGSYGYWHKAHVEFFTQHAADIGVTFNESSLLVLERFKKIYPISGCN